LPVEVTLGTLHRLMSAGQGEPRAGVVKHRTQPPRGCVARLTGGGKSCRHMIWVGRLIEVGLMAAHAGGGQSLVDPVRMTLRALHRDVCAGQRKGCR
jgi:hypothetical protein